MCLLPYDATGAYSFPQIASFKDISVDKGNAPKLQIFDIVLGALYMAALAVELIGLLGAALVCSIKVLLNYISDLGDVAKTLRNSFVRILVSRSCCYCHRNGIVAGGNPLRIQGVFQIVLRGI